MPGRTLAPRRGASAAQRAARPLPEPPRPTERDQPLRLLISSVGCGTDLVQVADHAEVGQLEDRRLGVLVDGHDRLRGLHAGAVLDRAGDAGGDVQLRRDRLAGLADLVAVRIPAGVDRGTRGADGGAERVGERLDRARSCRRCRGRRRPRSRPRSARGDRSPCAAARPVIRAAFAASETGGVERLDGARAGAASSRSGRVRA